MVWKCSSFVHTVMYVELLCSNHIRITSRVLGEAKGMTYEP